MVFESTYPIQSGYVFKLDGVRRRYCSEANAYLNYVVYLWIQRVGMVRKNMLRKDRPVKVLTFYKPESPTMQAFYMCTERKGKTRVQHDTVVNTLKKGYEIIAKECHYNGAAWAYSNFYKAIGVL